ncbi:MAG TPA: HAD-IA family hydrolase [Methylomirabilota bacterium]|nr:HAD-IA family hydrolase [Methylomirabilota bacterium]
MRVCVFDLDHTLVRSPLDLAAMALDMRAVLESCHGPLPARGERYRVGELLAYCRRLAPALEEALWGVALDHERRALNDAALEPGAYEALQGSRAAGWSTAVWTNNARAISLTALERFGLLPYLDVVVTRDDMGALKPDPDGWRVIAKRLAPDHGLVVGDSWVDGLAAAAAGVPFVAYRADPAELARRGVSTLASLRDLAALPGWLTTYSAREVPSD